MSDSLAAVTTETHMPPISERCHVPEPTVERKHSLQVSGEQNGEELKQYTPEDLAQYDGTGPDKRILIAIREKVYDVSSARDMYGPGKKVNP